MIKNDNQYFKNGLLTIGFYILLLIIIFLIYTFSSSGSSCMSGFGTAILIIYGIPFISGIMSLIGLIKYFIGENEKFNLSLIINLSIFIICILFILITIANP
jgi:hypothetical protein